MEAISNVWTLWCDWSPSTHSGLSPAPCHGIHSIEYIACHRCALPVTSEHDVLDKLGEAVNLMSRQYIKEYFAIHAKQVSWEIDRA